MGAKRGIEDSGGRQGNEGLSVDLSMHRTTAIRACHMILRPGMASRATV
jgi:hypothetical protein